MSLRLQVAGYTIRFGAYAGDGFKEGVSLSVYDELNRWEKYAFGCNELIFHPVFQWIYKGPFTPIFRKFLFSPIPIASKITNLAYIGNYYGIGASWILTIMNYFLMGWYNGYLDKYYLDSFRVYFSLIIVFAALGNFSLAFLRYRMGERNFFGSCKFAQILSLSHNLTVISLREPQMASSHDGLHGWYLYPRFPSHLVPRFWH